MTTTDFSDLHPESQAIIAALRDAALDDLPKMEVSEEALARYACGWITTEESDAVVYALTCSSAMRERLVEMRGNIRAAEAGPAERARVFSKDIKLGEVMSAAFRSSVKVLSEWSHIWSTATVAEVPVEDKRSIRALLQSLGARLDVNRLQPAVARMRGASQAAKIVVEPGNVFANLSVHVSDDESVIAKAEFSKPFAEPKEISLYVVEPGGAWSWIGSNMATGSNWVLKTPEYAAMLGLPAGDVSGHCFALSEGRWLMPRGWVALHVSEDLRARGISSPTRLRLRKPPIISGGEFVIGFDLPEGLKEAFAEDRLTLSMQLGSSSYVLGSWPVKDLPPTSEIELRAPSAGLPDCEFESYSAIQLTMRA